MKFLLVKGRTLCKQSCVLCGEPIILPSEMSTRSQERTSQ
jgi:hypothetical protein